MEWGAEGKSTLKRGSQWELQVMSLSKYQTLGVEPEHRAQSWSLMTVLLFVPLPVWDQVRILGSASPRGSGQVIS